MAMVSSEDPGLAREGDGYYLLQNSLIRYSLNKR